MGYGTKCSSHSHNRRRYSSGTIRTPVECEQGITNLFARMLEFITSTRPESSNEAEPKSEGVGENIPRLKSRSALLSLSSQSEPSTKTDLSLLFRTATHFTLIVQPTCLIDSNLFLRRMRLVYQKR